MLYVFYVFVHLLKCSLKIVIKLQYDKNVKYFLN